MSGVPDFALGTTIDFKFTTRRFSTGAPFALASGVISAYVDNSTTQITAGITLTADFDTVTGLNNVRVVLTSGNGYAAGTCIDFVITTGTVDSVSVVGEVVYQCTIEKQSALRPVTDGRELVVDANGLADANAVKVGPTGSGTAQTAGDIMADTNDIQTRLPAALVGGRMDVSVGAMAANVMTAAAAAADLTTELQSGLATQASVDTIDDFLDTEVAAILAAVDTEVAAIKAKTDNLPAAPAATGDIPSAATIATAVLTTAMTEAYAADGATFTVAQALYEIAQSIGDFSISGTTLTVKKRDGSTTAATYTLNDATSPTSRTRAT